MSVPTPAGVTSLTDLAADVVVAYISNNPVPTTELPALIARVYGAISGLAAGPAAAGTAAAPVEVEKPTPGQVRRSITHDGIVSFVDGKSYKSLKRHLRAHGLHPQSYRERYGLPADYPMVAASYTEQRSALAKSIGLGRIGGLAERASGGRRDVA